MVERLVKRVSRAGRPKRIAQEIVPSGGCRRYIRFVNANIGGCVEWCLAVELKVVLGFQHVVKDAPHAAYAGLSVMERLPGKTESRREVRFVGKVDSRGRAFVAWKEQSQRRPRKHRGLRRTRNDGIGAPFGVRFGRAVFITKS